MIEPQLYDEYKNARWVSRYLGGVSERTIQRWAKDGRLPAVRFGRSYLFRVSDIDRAAEANRTAPQSEIE
jgi:excisionase family DNA binding protein